MPVLSLWCDDVTCIGIGLEMPPRFTQAVRRVSFEFLKHWAVAGLPLAPRSRVRNVSSYKFLEFYNVDLCTRSHTAALFRALLIKVRIT